jgi:hypothetical protein
VVEAYEKFDKEQREAAKEREAAREAARGEKGKS